MSDFKKWNHYTCQTCGFVTIARHDTEGVTPFMIRCRVKDTRVNGELVKGCQGDAYSSFFRGPQNDTQTPHIIFYRPETMAEAIEIISREPRRFREDILEHYRLGGALMRGGEMADS